jgi:hypothetical protein
MKQETSVATILCYSTFARARAVWSCVLRINDQKWYHEHCYYEIRGLTPFADDPLPAEAEAVIAGISQAVNAHGLTNATIWVQHPLLLEVAQRAEVLPSLIVTVDEDESDAGRQEYEQAVDQVKTFMQADWAQYYLPAQREHLAHFVEQLITVRDHAVLQWRLLPEDAASSLPPSLADDYRKALALARSLLVTEHPGYLAHMAFGHIIEGQPTQLESVIDDFDLSGLGAMVGEDDPAIFFTQRGAVGRQLHQEENQMKSSPSRITRYPWIYANRSSTGVAPQGEEKARGGHWRVYVLRDAVDELWAKVAHAVEQGQLGTSARVSTASPTHTFKHQEHMISIFSSDARDEAEVRRIRARLMELGVTWPIAYKGHGTRPPRLPPLPEHDPFTLYYE